MYLSHLLVDVGQNPDRPRPGRQWLGNIYRVHQRLAMGFPSATQVRQDPEVLDPFGPEQFFDGVRDVHESRDESKGFLFRVDYPGGGGPVIVVQSARLPDWNYAFSNAVGLLRAPAMVREWRPIFTAGQTLRFRLRANPTKRSISGTDDASAEGAKKSRRLALTWATDEDPECAMVRWLGKKIETSGFRLQKCTLAHLGWTYGYRGEQKMKFRSALLEGILEVVDPDRTLLVVQKGIGPAKAFGFGLLSVAPI